MTVLAGSLLSASAQVPVATMWTASWGSAQTAPYGSETLPANSFDGATLRETVHLSAGGSKLRLLLANTFGQQPLMLRSVSVRLRAKAGAAPLPSVPVTFRAATEVTVPEQAELLSDPVSLTTPVAADLEVTMVIDRAPTLFTLHAGAHATAMLAPGDQSAADAMVNAQTFTRWYFLSGVQVSGGTDDAGVVAFGDSITDGHASTTDGNDRWPDALARRLEANAGTANIGVVNEGIGGNCLLQVCVGQSALTRFDRDVLARPAAKYLIVLEGINDIGGFGRAGEHSQAEHDALVERLEMALTQIAERAHQHGLRVYGGTLTSFVGSGYYHPDARSEADRTTLNAWIRTSGVFDAVIDFDAALRDPAHPDRMLPAYDSGDHLHPGPAGYARMAEAIPVSLFTEARSAHVSRH